MLKNEKQHYHDPAIPRLGVLPNAWEAETGGEQLLTADPSVHRQVNGQQTGVCPYSGVRVNLKMEGHSDTGYNADEP